MSKKLKQFALFLFLVEFFLFPIFAFARENVTDWYIKDFDSQIVVNKDSSLDITETIIADCGIAQGKHGIFRILPLNVKIEGKTIPTPVELISITDENNQPWKYSESKNKETVTWKIGDPNVTVQGVNTFKISYTVKNAIRFQEKFDELYWNLNGNFWDLETDKFRASIIFPEGINQSNAALDQYAGFLGEQRSDLATYSWSSPQVLEINSTKTLQAKEGITVAVTFPKNVIMQYQPNPWDLYGKFLYLIIPLIAFAVAFTVWRKYGDDPNLQKTIIPQYDVPGNLTPTEMGMLMKNGAFTNSFITAEIIYLATKGLVTIREINEKILVFNKKDYELQWNKNEKVEKELSPIQTKILELVFKKGSIIKLSSLKNEFYKDVSDIVVVATAEIKKKGLVVMSGLYFSIFFKVVASVFFIASFEGLLKLSLLHISLLLTGIIILIFSFIMPKRTVAGANLNWEVEGFKLFMETVDRDRAPFYEKENIFEKCLPYAMIFGITGLWIKKMQEIYGEQYFAKHAPLWYAGTAGGFNADSFESSMNSLSSSIAANTSSPSGSGGGGSSGGGGGGGGGGGW